MALRAIRLIGDEMLTKPCREVQQMTPRTQELIDDMLETMYEANGIGLAAPQVGVLRQIAVIDIWQDDVVEYEKELEESEQSESAEDPEDSENNGDAGKSEEESEPKGTEESEEESEPKNPEGSEGEPDEDDEWIEDDDFTGPLIMINPVITRQEGEQTNDEGCLSLPGKAGKVTRPYLIEVTYFDENMESYDMQAEGLLARAICHEVDHLSGHTYVELVEGEIHDVGGGDSEEDEESEAEEELAASEEDKPADDRTQEPDAADETSE